MNVSRRGKSLLLVGKIVHNAFEWGQNYADSGKIAIFGAVKS